MTMRFMIAMSMLLTACSVAWGEDGIMVCSDKYGDTVYIKPNKNLFGKYKDLQQKHSGTWYSICEPATQHYTQFCKFLDRAIEVIEVFEKTEDRPKIKYTTLYDFELKFIRTTEELWDDEKNQFLVIDYTNNKQCKMLADIK